MNKTIKFKNTVEVQTWTTHFFNVSKVVINNEDVCIDVYNSSNQLMGSIYYSAYNNKLDVWIEDYENNKTIDLVDKGELKCFAQENKNLNIQNGQNGVKNQKKNN